MRILAGKFKGRTIKRRIPEGVRPTQDSIKESIFNTLANYLDFEGILAADICAGTGALGFEAFSRGAQKVVFIEKNKKTAQFIFETVDELNINRNELEIIQCDALVGIRNYKKNYPTQKFDLIFSDPPYQTNIPNDLLKTIADLDLLTDSGILVIETSTAESLILPDKFIIDKEKIYGGTKVFYIIMAE